MGLILKQSQVAGNNATQVQIGTLNEDPVEKQKKTDTVICDVADWIKAVAVLIMFPGWCWFTYAFIRMVILDVYHRCAGTGWIYVFWIVLSMNLCGYLLMMLGCLLYKHHHWTTNPV